METPEEHLKIKREWATHLEQGEKVTLKWDAGGDETPIWIYVDGVEVTDYKKCEGIFDLVIDKLDLPNVGEYFVEGGGELLLLEGQLAIRHESKHTGADWDIPDDYDPETFDMADAEVVVDKTVSETDVLVP